MCAGSNRAEIKLDLKIFGAEVLFLWAFYSSMSPRMEPFVSYILEEAVCGGTMQQSKLVSALDK